MNNTIPIFFASNDKYVPYLDVAILSIIANASKENNYEIIILKTDISEENQNKLLIHNKENITIKFYDVKEILERQLKYNKAISEEGLKNDWGANIGSLLLNNYGNDV